MKNGIKIFATILILSQSLSAQFDQRNNNRSGGGGELPLVRINDHSASLQFSLFPDYYRTHSAADDMRWVAAHDSDLVDFWESHAISIMATLENLSGISWQEETFDFYFVRWYPSVGEGDPLIIPLGGIKNDPLNEAAPTGSSMHFGIILQLAKRMLAQAERTDDPAYWPLANSLLMQPGPYRRDNLALLLAIVTAQEVLGLDATYESYKSAFWQERLPGVKIFEKYMLSDWILTQAHTLADWIVEEPRGSSLIRASRPPKMGKSLIRKRPQLFIDDLPLAGQLGFSVSVTESRRLLVQKIDPARAGFMNGLREGDLILSVNGRRVRNHKQLVEGIYETFTKGGATLTLIRAEETILLPVRPIMIVDDENALYWQKLEDSLLQEELKADSLFNDSIEQ